MTDTQDLIARLRKDDLFWEAPITCRSEAADALQSAQAEIERLRTTVKHLSDAAANATFAEKAALARLAELEKQEPIGYLYDWVHSSATGRADETYTGFTKDKAHAYKNDNVIAIYAAAGASPKPSQAGLSESKFLEWILHNGSQELVGVSTYRTSHMGAPETVRLTNAAMLIAIAAINAKESGK